MVMRHIKVYPDNDSLVAGTAEWIFSACGEAIAGGACTIALSGGSTPRALYRLLASDPWASVSTGAASKCSRSTNAPSRLNTRTATSA